MKHVSRKVKNLPPYLFSKFQKRKKELEKSGVDVIDLGIGAPDLPSPDFVVDELVKMVQKPENHQYSPYDGHMVFKEAVAQFYRKRYKVDLNPSTEILTLIGSKEGIAHFTQAVLNPGDYAFVPNPGYPVYKTAVTLADGTPIEYALTKEHNYVPQFHELKKKAHDVTLMFLNYPSNPTSATIHLNTFLEAITFVKEHNILIAHDAAYDLVTFSNYQSPSILQVPDAKQYAVEFGSLSKSFNLTGWRIGYVVGNSAAIGALSTLKNNVDTSQFLTIQKAAAKALLSDLSFVEHNNQILQERMELMHQGLIDIGIKAKKPQGTIFIWAKVPSGFTSTQFADKLLDEAGIIVTPGNAFGSAGEGYVRIAFTVTKERIQEAIKRMSQLNLREGK